MFFRERKGWGKMIKVFCDVCEEEITEENKASRMKAEFRDAKGKKLFVEVFISYKGTLKSLGVDKASEQLGDFCKYCILNTLYKLDDRPKIDSSPK